MDSTARDRLSSLDRAVIWAPQPGPQPWCFPWRPPGGLGRPPRRDPRGWHFHQGLVGVRAHRPQRLRELPGQVRLPRGRPGRVPEEQHDRGG